jgi:nucleoid DNA-binding protein
MTKANPLKRDEFVKQLMALGLKKNQAQLALESFISCILDGLKAGKKITIVGLGTWEWKTRSSRKTRNPKTGKTFHLKSRKVLVFSPTPTLKKKLNS